MIVGGADIFLFYFSVSVPVTAKRIRGSPQKGRGNFGSGHRRAKRHGRITGSTLHHVIFVFVVLLIFHKSGELRLLHRLDKRWISNAWIGGSGKWCFCVVVFQTVACFRCVGGCGGIAYLFEVVCRIADY